MSSDSPLNVGPLNIVFAGTPDFSASVLESILEAGHHVSAVYCQPDRRVGRGKKLVFGPVKALAVEKGIAVEQPIRFNQEVDEHDLTAVQRLANFRPDIMIVVAYGLILPEEVLVIPKFGCVNIHASLLPRWRGAAPIQRAIEQGDNQTGITIMKMDKGLDTGNMLLTESCELKSTDTGSILHDRLAKIGCQAINQFLSSFNKESGSPYSPGEIQKNQLATYAHKLSKAEAEIDWTLPAKDIERKIRAFNSWPVSFTFVGKNRLRVWQAENDNRPEFDIRQGGHLSENNLSKTSPSKTSPLERLPGTILSFDKQGILVRCGDGQNLLLTQLQADGSRAMSVAEMLNSKSQWFSQQSTLGKVDKLGKVDGQSKVDHPSGTL